MTGKANAKKAPDTGGGGKGSARGQIPTAIRDRWNYPFSGHIIPVCQICVYGISVPRSGRATTRIATGCRRDRHRVESDHAGPAFLSIILSIVIDSYIKNVYFTELMP